MEKITKNFCGKIIFKKFKVKKLLSSTAFSNVYEGINIKNNIPVALKIEKKGKDDQLESEAYILLSLKGFGIPEIISFGKYGLYKVLVEELLGPNIQDLWEKHAFKKDPWGYNNKFIKDVCILAIQGLDRLEFIHNKNILHRDIKTNNFIIGRKDPNIIYIIDFGFSRKYRSSRTGKHIKFSRTNHFLGSLFFSSRHCIKGFEVSRRDDLESFGYMLIYLAKGGHLPWKQYYSIDIMKKIKELAHIKMEISDEKLCSGLPNEFVYFMKHVKQLKFEEEPNYKYLRGLFIEFLSRIEMKVAIRFFWIKTKDQKKTKKLIENNSHKYSDSFVTIDPFTKKSNYWLKRLYNHIKSALEQKSKNNSLYNIDKRKNFPLKNTSKTNYEIHPISLEGKKYTNINITKKNINGNALNIKKETKSLKTFPQNNKEFTIENNSNQNTFFQEKIFKIESNKEKIFSFKNTNNNKLNKNIENRKGIALYYNKNYNNIYFINNNSNNNSPIYQLLNNRNFKRKFEYSQNTFNNNSTLKINTSHKPSPPKNNQIKRDINQLNYM